MATTTQIEQQVTALAARVANEFDTLRAQVNAIPGSGGEFTVDWTSQVTGKPTTFTPSAHTHATADITGLQAYVDGRVGAVAPAAHTHVAADVTDFNTAVDARIALVPPGTPAWGDITDKPLTFTPSAHTHTSADITDFTAEVNELIALAGAGSGNVAGPVSSVDNEIVLFSGASGQIIKSAGAAFSANGLSLVSAANYAAMRTLLGAGQGDVVGPAGATDGHIVLFDTTTGKLIKSAGQGFSANGLTLVGQTFANMRTSLGLVIGTDVQAQNAKLAAVAGMTWAADKGLYTTGASTVATFDLSTYMRGLLASASSNAARIALDDKESLIVALGDETTDITTGVAKVTFRMPYAVAVDLPRASLSAASSSGTPTFDINKNGVSIFSTRVTIDASEKTSATAAAPAVMTSTPFNFDADDEVTIDIDVAGTGAKGAKIVFVMQRL